MKKLAVIMLALLFMTGCVASNGNSISKVECTVYKKYSHDEMVLDSVFDKIKNEFINEDTFYHASLLTIEYGKDDPTSKEQEIKEQQNAYEVVYVEFSFKTGSVLYEHMQSNHVYKFGSYMIKFTDEDDWHFYDMKEV